MANDWQNRSFHHIRTYPKNRFSFLSSPKMRLWKLWIVNWLSTGIVVGVIVAVIMVIGIFLWYSRDLPSPDRAKRHEGFSTIIMDRDNKPLYDIFSEKNRIPVAFSDIPESLKQATISIEDKDFYTHQGFDPKGMVRAFFRVLTFQGLQSGSTLTQQLVKNALLTQEQTLPRKIKEFILSVQLERKYSKDEILQMYLNETPYGGTMWGIESAAQGYFGKHAKDLTLLESVILAGLPQSPSYYSPFNGEKNYVGRAEEVLRRMREDGHITQVQEAELKRQLPNVTFSADSGEFRAAHFVMYVKKQLEEKFGEKMVEGGGLRVKTTLDGKLQEKAEAIMREELDKVKNLKVTNGAAVALNPGTGEILAYIGSRDYEAVEATMGGKFDVVSLGLRQPGSALKPITYAVAFEKGYTPSTVLMDVETHFPSGDAEKKDYVPKNYDLKWHGPVQVRFALGNSVNIPAVKMTAMVGIKEILTAAHEMGLSTLEPTDANVNRFGLAMTLGGGEVRLLDLTQAYGVFATGGVRNDLYAIDTVTDSSGKVLYQHHPTTGKRVLSEDVSFLISHIMSDNNARKDVFGTNSYLVVPSKSVAVKTGTTDDKRDNWTVGYTPSVVVGVWVGNNDNSPMNPKLASGVSGAAPIWNRIIKEALKDKKDEPFKVPDSVVSVEIDADLGGLPRDGKPKRSEYYIKGTEPTAVSPFFKKLKISKADSSKLANAVEIATGQYDERDFIVFTEDDPTSLDKAVNKWQEGIDAWVATQSDGIYKPPKETSNRDENTVAVSIKEPSDKQKFDDNKVNIRATAKALREIKKMEIEIDGQNRDSVDGSSIEKSYDLSTGVHKIKVKARDEKGNTGDSEITIGVKVDPNAAPTSTPVPSPTP